MPLALGAFIWYVLEILAIYFSLVFSIRMLGIETKENTRFLYFALPLLSLCVLLLSGIMRCQASEFVIFFSIATFYYSQRNRVVLSAISFAFATLIKVFPASLILYFIFKKNGIMHLPLQLHYLLWGCYCLLYKLVFIRH
jgi:hypothetical protein